MLVQPHQMAIAKGSISRKGTTGRALPRCRRPRSIRDEESAGPAAAPSAQALRESEELAFWTFVADGAHLAA